MIYFPHTNHFVLHMRIQVKFTSSTIIPKKLPKQSSPSSQSINSFSPYYSLYFFLLPFFVLSLPPPPPPLNLCPSTAQTPADPKTMAAPTKTPGGNSLPKSQILKKSEINFRTLSAMVTPNADVRAESRLTPRMQIYCVNALATKLRI